jgi:hypothetical protein
MVRHEFSHLQFGRRRRTNSRLARAAPFVTAGSTRVAGCTTNAHQETKTYVRRVFVLENEGGSCEFQPSLRDSFIQYWRKSVPLMKYCVKLALLGRGATLGEETLYFK